jgi:hypothetical protein
MFYALIKYVDKSSYTGFCRVVFGSGCVLLSPLTSDVHVNKLIERFKVLKCICVTGQLRKVVGYPGLGSPVATWI